MCKWRELKTCNNVHRISRFYGKIAVFADFRALYILKKNNKHFLIVEKRTFSGKLPTFVR